MERRKMIIVVLIVAIVLGGIATFSIWSYLQSKQQEVEKAKVEMLELVAAAENIPLGSTIEQKQLKKVLWPRANVPPGTFTDPGPLVGRIVVSNIVMGEPLMEAKLASSESRAGGVMAYIIPEGHRAMAVAVNDVAGVAGFVLPNSTVDVIVTTTPPKGERISKIVLQNLRILAVGQKLEEKDGKAMQVPTVTVSITPEEAEKLALASNVGTLQLLLRGAKDNAPTSTRGASTANLLGGSGQPVVARVARRTSVVAAPVRENEEVNITIIKSDKGGTTRSQERLIEDGGFWKRSEVSK